MGARDRRTASGGKGGLAPWVRVVLALVVLAFGMALGRIARDNDVVRQAVAQYGYVGVFVVALVSGFNVVVPVPAVAFMPLFVTSGLDLATTLGIIVVGVTVADLVAFSLGRAGADLEVLERSRAVRRLRALRERHYWMPLAVMFFYACLAPFPNELLAIPLGLMKYPARHMILPLLLGNLVFTAYATFAVLALFAKI